MFFFINIFTLSIAIFHRNVSRTYQNKTSLKTYVTSSVFIKLRQPFYKNVSRTYENQSPKVPNSNTVTSSVPIFHRNLSRTYQNETSLKTYVISSIFIKLRQPFYKNVSRTFENQTPEIPNTKTVTSSVPIFHRNVSRTYETET